MICIILHYLGKASAFLVSVLVGIIVLIAFSPAFIGLNLLGFQIVFWAGTEEWIGIHLSDAVDILAADLAFFDRLRDLDGPLGRAFEMIPLAFLLIVAGFLLAASVAYTYDGLRDKLRRGREKPSQNDPVSDHSHAIKPRPRIDYPIRNASKKRPLQHWRPPRHEEPQSISLAEKQGVGSSGSVAQTGLNLVPHIWRPPARRALRLGEEGVEGRGKTQAHRR